MARDGTGNYSLLVNSWNPAANGVSASYTDWQSLINDVATAMTQSVSKDGQTVITGNLQMGNNKLTGLSAGTATGHSLRWEQLFSQGTETDIASAGTVDIGAQNTAFLRVTGTTTITSLGTNYNGPRFLRFAGAATVTHNATTLICPGGATFTTTAGDTFIATPKSTLDGWVLVATIGLNILPARLGGTGVTTGLPTLPLRGYIDGFSFTTTGPSTTLTIGAGSCSNGSVVMTTASLAKTTSSWSLGAGGLLDTGAISPSTTYHMYAIRRPDTGVDDLCGSLSASAPTFGSHIPSDYTQYRYIGSWKTNGSSQWVPGRSYGDRFLLEIGVTEYNAAVSVFGTSTMTSCPTGVEVWPILKISTQRTTASPADLLIMPGAASSSTVSAHDTKQITTPGTSTWAGTSMDGPLTNTSGQLKIQSSTGTIDTAIIVCGGWISSRGANKD